MRSVGGEQLELARGHAGEVRPDQRRLPAGLLVLPRAAHEHRHVDLRREQRGRERVGRATGSRYACESNAATRLAFWWRSSWFSAHCCADRAAAVDDLMLPTLAVRARRVVAFLRPFARESDVRDAAGIGEAAVRVGDDRQRGDRGEVGRPGRRDERLRDTRIGDADHARHAVQHPRLRGDRFDDVVPVELLQLFEEVERAARATGAADVDADGCVPEELCDLCARLRRTGM